VGSVENTGLRHEVSYSPCWPVDRHANGLGTGIASPFTSCTRSHSSVTGCVQQSEKDRALIRQVAS
jgi:hypothetical protein